MTGKIRAEMTRNKPLKLCDIHQHIVFGVDDGAKDLETSAAMLEECVRQNITSVVCTFHVRGDTMMEATLKYLSRYAELFHYIEDHHLPVSLFQGSEILYSEQTLDQLSHGIALPLGKSDRVLIEFHPMSSYETVKGAVSMLYNEGYRPVLAHVERCECLRDLYRLSYLRSRYRVLTQMNAATVVSAGKLFGNRFAKKAIRRGLIDLVGSDAHNLSTRKVNLKSAAEALTRMVGEEKARHMCHDTARAILRRDN